MTLAAFLLALAGFALVAASTPRLRTRALAVHGGVARALGFALLAGSLAARLNSPGWRIGLVEWVGELTAAAVIVVLLAAWQARTLPLVGAFAAFGAALVVAF